MTALVVLVVPESPRSPPMPVLRIEPAALGRLSVGAVCVALAAGFSARGVNEGAVPPLPSLLPPPPLPPPPPPPLLLLPQLLSPRPLLALPALAAVRGEGVESVLEVVPLPLLWRVGGEVAALEVLEAISETPLPLPLPPPPPPTMTMTLVSTVPTSLVVVRVATPSWGGSGRWPLVALSLSHLPVAVEHPPPTTHAHTYRRIHTNTHKPTQTDRNRPPATDARHQPVCASDPEGRATRV
jgi:hypothetical protein